MVRAQASSCMIAAGLACLWRSQAAARKSQFQQAARFVAELDVPVVLALPGNHDIPLFDPIARLFFPYANYAGAFGAELEPSFESSELLMLTVNTTRASRHVNGEVSGRQIERVADRLRGASSQQLRIVVTHQPVHVTRNEDLHNLLRGSERAVPRCATRARLTGRRHIPSYCGRAGTLAELGAGLGGEAAPRFRTAFAAACRTRST